MTHEPNGPEVTAANPATVFEDNHLMGEFPVPYGTLEDETPPAYDQLPEDIDEHSETRQMPALETDLREETRQLSAKEQRKLARQLSRKERKEQGRTRTKKAIGAFAVVAAIGTSFIVGNELNDDNEAALESRIEDADKACPESWGVVETNNERNRVIADGLPSLGEAKTNGQARKAVQEAWDIVKHDDEIMTGWGKQLVGSKHEAKDVVTGPCFNENGEQLAAQVEAFLATSRITPEDPSAGGYNTGTDRNGNMVVSARPGITGDRSGVTIHGTTGVMKDEKVGLMKRCVNFVFPEKPKNIPEGPTDQPTPTPTPGVSPSPSPEIPPKNDDGILPGDPNVPADQDPGTPDQPGDGPAGQQPGDDGYVPGETKPTQQPDYQTPRPNNTPQPQPSQPPAETGPPQQTAPPATPRVTQEPPRNTTPPKPQ